MPIVREADGIAMSSRNAYLSAAERRAARCLSRALDAGAMPHSRLASAIRRRCSRSACAVLDAEPLARVDYAELVDAETAQPAGTVDRPALLALAVFIGKHASDRQRRARRTR